MRAIITGVASGIGRAVAERLIADGANRGTRVQLVLAHPFIKVIPND